MVPSFLLRASARTTNELKGFVAYAKHNRIVNVMCFGACLYTVPDCISFYGQELKKRISVEELKGKEPVEEVQKQKSGLDQAETQVPL